MHLFMLKQTNYPPPVLDAFPFLCAFPSSAPSPISSPFTAPLLPSHEPTPVTSLQLSPEDAEYEPTPLGLPPEMIKVEDVYLLLRLLYADGRRSEGDALRALFPNLPPPPRQYVTPAAPASTNNLPRPVVPRSIAAHHPQTHRTYVTTVIPLQAITIDPSRDLFLGYHAVLKTNPVISTNDDYFQELGEGFYFYSNYEVAQRLGRLIYPGSEVEIVSCYIKPDFRQSYEENRKIRFSEKKDVATWDWVMGLLSGTGHMGPYYDVQPVMESSWGREILEAPAPRELGGLGVQVKLGYGYRDYFVMVMRDRY